MLMYTDKTLASKNEHSMVVSLSVIFGCGVLSVPRSTDAQKQSCCNWAYDCITVACLQCLSMPTCTLLKGGWEEMQKRKNWQLTGQQPCRLYSWGSSQLYSLRCQRFLNLSLICQVLCHWFPNPSPFWWGLRSTTPLMIQYSHPTFWMSPALPSFLLLHSPAFPNATIRIDYIHSKPWITNAF